MALTRKVLGAVYKSKDPTKSNYIKLAADVNLKTGQYIQVESQKFQRESLERAVAAGKLGADSASKISERIERMPEFVLAELVVLEERTT